MNQLGRYELKELIGEGAMSQVYKAYDPALQRTLAIKVLKPDFAQDKERLSYFLNEVTISGKLNHPNIVQIFDVGEVGDVPFIVMEFVDCESLDEWLARQHEVPLETVIDIVEQLGSALEYAHSKGIVHRDLKPSNVLIESNGRVRLTDFGVAYLHEQTDVQQVEEGETIVGTPYYMSPEQLAGKTPDQRSDLYSLGVVMYQLVFGTLPFEASTIRDLFNLIQTSDVNLHTSRCPHAVKKVIRRLLHKKATFRYSSAKELLKQLEALDLELANQASKWSERITATWLYTAVVAGACSVLLIGFLLFTLNDLSKNLTQVLSDYGSMLVQQTKEQVDEALLLNDSLALAVSAERIASNEQVNYLYITDHSGTIKASSDTQSIGTIYRAPAELQPLTEHQGSRVSQLPPSANNGERVYNFKAPILFNEKIIGSVVMGLSAGSIDDVWWRTTSVLVCFILLVCVSISALVFFICRFFTGEFKHLGRAMQSLYVGNYFTRLPVSKIDEVGYAKRQFNELAEQMETFIKESDPDIEQAQLSESEIETDDNKTVVIRKTEDVT